MNSRRAERQLPEWSTLKVSEADTKRIGRSRLVYVETQTAELSKLPSETVRGDAMTEPSRLRRRARARSSCGVWGARTPRSRVHLRHLSPFVGYLAPAPTMSYATACS